MKNLTQKLFALFLACGITFSLQAQETFQGENLEGCQLISSAEVINQASAETGGTVVSIQLQDAGPDSVYRVRVLVGENRIRNLVIRACR